MKNTGYETVTKNLGTMVEGKKCLGRIALQLSSHVLLYLKENAIVYVINTVPSYTAGDVCLNKLHNPPFYSCE